MHLYLASSNAHKLIEFRQLLFAHQVAIELHGADALGGMPEVDENGLSFADNARIKARALIPQLPDAAQAVLADDSGLCVDALDGAPGLHSARYAGVGATDTDNCAKLLQALESVPATRRTARFICVLCLMWQDGREKLFSGECRGMILTQPKGGDGFGYDPLFVPDGHLHTFAELSAEEKNRRSHRALAVRELVKAVRKEGLDGGPA